MRILTNLIFGVIESLIRNVSGGFGRLIRFWYYKHRLGFCGKNVVIDIGVIINNPEYVFVGDNVWLDSYVVILAGKPGQDRKILLKENSAYKYDLGELHLGYGVHIAPFCVLQSHGGMSIGANSGVASGAKLYSLSHHYRNLHDRLDISRYHFTPRVGNEQQFLISAPVVLGVSTAVGLNSTVLPGTHLPDGTWLGVQTFVQGQGIEGESVYAGVAATMIKSKK